MSKYVWPNDNKCSILHLYSGRRCNVCGRKTRFLVNVGKKQYQHLTCGLRNVIL
jgi:hypothetical protein